MTDQSSSRFSLLKSIGLFMGASFFAYLLSIALHELGHYVANIILGVPERGIVLNPFGANYNLYLGDTGAALGTPLRSAFSGASGPLFDLLIAVILGLLLWRKRSPGLLPLLLLGSYALLHESVAMIMAAIGDASSGDWGQVMSVGIPPSVIILLAAVMLAAGCLWILQLLPVAGIRFQDSFWRKMLVLLAGIPLLFLCAVTYQTLFSAEFYVPTFGGVMMMQGLRVDKIIFMVASIVLTAIVTPLHKPLFPWLDKISHTALVQVR